MSAPIGLTFVTSAPDMGRLPPSRAEVAVIGRSNVGKSSLLNALAARRDLAKVSGTPGRTQLLNVFAAADGATLVDLPGFGFAATASKTDRAAWRRRMEGYLLERLRAHGVPFQVVATKHDKVKSARRHRRQRDLAVGCGLDPAEVLWVSAEKSVGVDRLRAVIREALTLT